MCIRDRLGTLSLSLEGEVLTTVDLLASHDVEASGLLLFWRNVRNFFSSNAVTVVGIALLVLAAALIVWKPVSYTHLWSGVMEIMNVCGLSAVLARAFRPILRRLMPQASRDEKTLAALSANVSANLLGLGNAATPLGIQAARRMARGCSGTASDELCLLVVLNTASIQLLPATIASRCV